jgi:hypothetical protein
MGGAIEVESDSWSGEIWLTGSNKRTNAQIPSATAWFLWEISFTESGASE